MIPDLTTITEATARILISSGNAGYWEMQPRDSISKSPIAHSVQTCIFVGGIWYLVPVEHFRIIPHGRGQFGDVNAQADTITCSHPGLILAMRAQLAPKYRDGGTIGLN